MITYLAPLPIGNAARCLFSAPAGATACKVLRRATLPFVGGINDTGAAVVYDGSPSEPGFIDAQSLQNDTLAYYQDYYLVAGVWTFDAGPVSVTPTATGQIAGPDPQELVRDRLEWGLKVEVDAGRLKHVDGAIPTLSAPPIYEETQFPIVTVHLAGMEPFAHGVGEVPAPDVFDLDADDWLDAEGYLIRFRLTVVAWIVGNPDTRIALRKAIHRILLGNLPVFADKGFIEVEWSAVDSEDFESYGAPMYQSIFTLTGIAPSAISALSPAIDDVTVDASAFTPAPLTIEVTV